MRHSGLTNAGLRFSKVKGSPISSVIEARFISFSAASDGYLGEV